MLCKLLRNGELNVIYNGIPDWSMKREDGGQCLYNDAIINDEASRITVNCAGPDVPQVFIYDTNGTLEHTWDDNSGTVGLLTDRQLPVTLRLNVSVAEGYPDADVQLLLPHDYEQRTNLPMLVYVHLHENLSFLDSNRTCIWGWSYGGYAASLALARGGDVFRCAAAVAPVEAYRNKRYFLVHGTADDNVHYQHAMLISRLLQRQDVYFTQMSYTDEDHGLVGVRPHLYHALEKFLEENML
ncbi:hypothetical protein MSG28_001437 [Choristoneura fumiferana]|uniref:Uncharacterized protein n=1 Tax=Choristoneura fumiferana TaxID=7141 RepID=A0ACC0KU30_CHOFU|nr:hypothetical protein MSG28_001437 [Choristoneura fumiferana]